ncbi:MAG: replication-associated recombination protein A [Pseudobdellovibrio sp.]
MNSLFETQMNDRLKPLAERLRPRSVAEVLGQDHILSEKSATGRLLKSGRLLNLIICGSPGTGKTSFAKALAATAKATFVSMNAVDAGAKDLKLAGEQGRQRLTENSEKTLLFVDEIHRFNKAQQDILLPFIEKGYLYLIGATTEHPSYELNRALLSRCQVVNFKRLESNDFALLFQKVSIAEDVQLEKIVSPEQLDTLIQFADGDGRRFLNLVESILELYKIHSEQESTKFLLSNEDIENLVGKKIIAYDKSSDQHYDCISAFIKSIRGSDADAALYYLVRMLEGGEDPVFISRRLIILASEDIGNAEPRALPLAIAGLQAVEAIGLPECRINLAQVVTFLASCPKSNRSYAAINKAEAFLKSTGSPELPEALKSSQKDSGKYIYPQDTEKGWVEQNYWPSKLQPQIFYEPSGRGQEKNIQDYLKWLKAKQ